MYGTLGLILSTARKKFKNWNVSSNSDKDSIYNRMLVKEMQGLNITQAPTVPSRHLSKHTSQAVTWAHRNYISWLAFCAS